MQLLACFSYLGTVVTGMSALQKMLPDLGKGLGTFSRGLPWQQHHTAAFVCLQHEEAIMKMIQKRGPQPPEETDLWACVSRLKDKSGGTGVMSRNSDVLGCRE